ncbi:hypothetical protein, conserved [Babesia ovata]|uniref:Extracellular matrix-binding ebh n=1 Tax=Babesia ovata TaxID=189622 RepID=A0A2H6KIL9_9APIC|nr:uncharacterized protein BOVATA_043370 [Babesia ovata]GBE62844.1 hypothetical protein, conserved [Babesia ovata]
MQFTLNDVQNKPTAIGKAVTAIKAQLKDLRGRLKDKSGNKENDVIHRLEDLKRNGLSGNPWNGMNVKGQPLSGLGKIHKELEEQNKELAKQPDIITNAIREIRDQLFQIGINLDHKDFNDDVIGVFTELGKMIGRSHKGYHANLEDIHYMLHWLQGNEFTSNSDAIGKANEAIKAELTALQGELQGNNGSDVIATLKDLQTNGLSGEKGWNKHNTQKSLKSIQNDLSTQQNTLEQQPGNIDQGVDQITRELTRLQKQLNTEVTDKLKKLKESGLTEGKTPWTDKGESLNGIQKITADIETIKDKDVEDVKEKLKELCTAIRIEANESSRDLKRLKGDGLNELRSIYSDLYDLYFGPLNDVIQLLKKFDKYADEAARRIIAELTQFVDQEIKEAEETLIREARRQYVSNIKEALKAFAQKVEEELSPLPPLINGDLQIGYKGFVYDFQQRFESHISPLKGTLQLDALSTAFKRFHLALSGYLSAEIRRVHIEESKKKNPSLPPTDDHYAERLYGVTQALEELLEHITKQKRFDRRLPEMLDKLAEAVGSLRPEKFAKVTTPILDGVAEAADKFEKELRTVYISTYDGAFEGRVLVDARTGRVTADGEKCAKILLTILKILCNDLTYLEEQCTRRYPSSRIYSTSGPGVLLHQMGYDVAKSPNSQDGELQNDNDITGDKIGRLLGRTIQHAGQNEHLKKCSAVKQNEQNYYNLFDVLACLCCHLYEYYGTCHLIIPPSPRTPCSVYQMLVWLTGLPHNRVYDRLKQQVKSVLSNADDHSTDTKWYMAAQPKSVTATNLAAALHDVTSYSPALLTRVLGYGDAMTTYAVDFYSNALQLYYPQDADDCLHMMLHILCRLLVVLRFLFSQCSLPAHHGGWAECQYGKGVPPYTWQCAPPVTALPTPHPECTDKSPLMSYLNDCLPGHLPHQVTNIGCEPVCQTCLTSELSTPCLTPLGFRGFSGSTRTGKELCKVLTKWFGNVHIKSLLSLCPRPPATLAEHISFASSLVGGWQHSALPSAIDAFQSAFTDSITGQSMTLYREPGKLTDALRDAYGNGRSGHGIQHSTAQNTDLSSLDAYHCLPHRHADVYLSWAVYLPWTLYELLLSLKTAFQAISCRDWGCGDCLHEEPCDPGSHGLPSPQSPGHSCRCRSIVGCKGVMPTLYSHGFTFGDAPALISQNKNCSTLAKQLSQVLHSDHFTELFHQIDQLIYRIRAPFLFTLFTLWLTATFYILHSLLYRMDVLRIRSHLLTTRASHLIDVKALLAGSRRMLSLYKDVDYFDDDFHSSLGQYIVDLDKWIEKTKVDIDAAQKLVQKILNEVNGNAKPKDNLGHLDKAIKRVAKHLQERADDLTKWKEAAQQVLEGTISSSTSVHEKLDPTQKQDPEATQIGLGIQKIEDAKTAVSGVITGLQDVHKDLEAWNSAAKAVLGKVVTKAQNVHTRLDPNTHDDQHKIGEKLGEIDTAKQGLDEANKTLLQQVTALGTWITSAEEIRKAAEDKAKEAYDKLKVNQTLDANVKKIVDANKKIASVHTELGKVHGNLGEWKQQAGDVLQGAINNAQHVHDKLQDEIHQKITTIEQHNRDIQTANTQLGGHVKDLTSWKSAASDVISKAEGKCDEILKKVQTDKGSPGPIFKEAKTLQDKGKDLLKAAKSAKEAVELKVTEALKAVVKMDTDLKRDLFNVKRQIQLGIGNVIDSLGVLKLDEKVMKDLQSLRSNILGLTSNGKVDSLVSDELRALAKQKSTLDQTTSDTGSIKMQTDELDNKFQSVIQKPLNEKVTAVDSAIERLYTKFDPSGQIQSEANKLEKIFEKIKGEVNKILNGEPAGRGLQGIAEGLIKSYAKGFVNFHTIVGGWAEGILGNNKGDDKKKTIKPWLGKYVTERKGSSSDVVKLLDGSILGFSWSQKIIEQIRSTFKDAIDQAAAKVEQANDNIQTTITSVKEACEEFVKGLDNKLASDGIQKLAQEIYDKIASEGGRKGYGGHDIQAAIKPAIQAALIGLSATASQVANEIKSILLDARVGNYAKGNSTSIAEELDRVVEETKKLDEQLTDATDSSQGTGPQESPAQAVDSKLSEVRQEVNNNIVTMFNDHVTKELKAEVSILPVAVSTFNQQAEAQIKAAAQTAITKAAGEISKNGAAIVLGDNLMNEFHTTHEQIKSSLDRELKQKVDDHIGKDDQSASQQGGQAQKIIIDKKNFGQYDKHVDQNEIKDGQLTGLEEEGSLPQAIGDIKALGLAELEGTIGDKASKDKKIEEKTFNDPFTKIKTQLGEIKGLVDGDGEKFFGGFDEQRKGVKTLLEDLRKGLNYNKLLGADRGLEQIKIAIKKLQQGTFDTEPKAIDSAVQAIRQQLGELRGKLKKDGDSDKTAVVNALQDLKEKGLGGHWTIDNGDWKTTKGLAIIQERLKTQNAILPVQTKSIDTAIKEIKGELARIGIKLNNVHTDHDIMDHLKQLANYIGKGKSANGYSLNVQKIHDVISALQSGVFTQKPTDIENANSAIKRELTTLRTELQGSKPANDVIETLTDLKNVGLSGTKWDENRNGKSKSLQTIESDLKGQQNELGQQPGKIDQGVQDITGELDSLRQKLKDEVNKKLDDLKNHGLTDGKKTWSDNGFNKGLTKITADVETIKEDNVKDVKEKLKELCTEIRTLAREAKRDLEHVKKDRLEYELTGIKDQLHNLQIRLVSGPIKACKEFIDRDADRFGRDCIASLTAFVNGQVTTAIDDITAFAKQQCAANIKELLKLFAQKVEEELSPLPPLINGDLQMGYKGFVHDFQQRFESHISPLMGTKQLDALSTGFKRFHLALSGYISTEIKRVHSEESKKKNPSLPPSEDHYAEKLYGVTHALEELLEHIGREKRFDRRLPEMLDKLAEAVKALRPEKFAKVTTPILDGVAEAADKFEKELRTVYISTYDGAFEGRVLVDARNSRVTADGEKCAKILLTILPTVCSGITKLNDGLAGRKQNWWHHKIHIGNKLGDFFASRGFKVSTDEGQNDAELQNSESMKGKHIHGILTEMVQDADGEHLKKCSAIKQTGQNNYNLFDLLACLCCHLNEYYETCHLIVPPSPRTPCNIYQMLCWLTGLPHNRVYDRLKQQVKSVLSNADDNSTDTKWYMDAQPNAVTATNLAAALHDVTSHSPALLTRVLGYGSASTTYACDFYSNALKLYYPQDGGDCLHMMLHILCRLLVVLRFLFSQCSLPAHHGGWAECQYGKGVPPYTWQCNPPLTALPNPHPECTDKSPLQSYLNDCLPGHLPHQLVSVGCEPRCNTCPSAPSGMPCLTPLGFRGFSGSTRTGKELCKVLTKWFGNVHIKSLLSLCPRPPATLAEHISFASSLVGGWQHSALPSAIDAFQSAFTASITGQSMTLYREPGKLTDALRDAYGNGRSGHGIQHSTSTNADLSSLSMADCCTLSNDASINCAPFLSALCSDAYHCLPHRHADLYLSWAVYLPWTLYDLLQCLFAAFQQISCRDWGCGDCLHEDPCDPGSHGLPSPQSPGHSCRCRSIVGCNGVMPTLYSHGFTFGDAPALISQNKNCSTLAKQLSQVLHSDHFTHLFDQCDQFLYRIRAPFLFCLIALWLIATVYILGVLLYRMDVLRIRSHLLTTRASHLIDVKALLAGSRRMLSLYKDVDYFDDDFHSRTPRTTGELVSFFHNFGNELHKSSSQLSPLGSALSKSHLHCPDWDRLKNPDLRVIRDARGSATPTSIHHDKDHPNTLSTLLGCDIDNVNCQQLMKPITYRAYALYSASFVHTYLSWTVYLTDRLWESLLKLHCDLEDLQCHDSKAKPLHQCPEALPLLYSHGFTPPEGMPQTSLTCSDAIAKLKEVVNGRPIASLVTTTNNFLYGIRLPFLHTVFTLWLIATLYIAHSLLYRMDVLRIRSHLLTTRASHLIDAKALLAGSRRMLSLYKDVDYFDDDFHS